MQIQISWLLQKPTELDLHCLQRQSISGFSRTRVNIFFIPIYIIPLLLGKQNEFQNAQPNCIPIPEYRWNFGEVHVAPAPQKKKKCLFQVEEINIGISLKAHAYSHMMHEKLHSKGTYSLHVFTS